MTKTLIALIALTLAGCGAAPNPMNEHSKAVFQACLDKGWKPYYFSNTLKVELSCVP